MNRADAKKAYESQCKDKIQHVSEQAAKAVRKFELSHQKNLSAYHCKHCGWWHLGRYEPLPEPEKKQLTKRQLKKEARARHKALVKY